MTLKQQVAVMRSGLLQQVETTLLAEERDRSRFAARVDPRTRAGVGGKIRVTVDPSRLYFFSQESGESLLDGAVAVRAAS